LHYSSRVTKFKSKGLDMAKLKPWYDVVELRKDLRENRPLDASEFAINLDQIRDGRAHKD